MAGRDCERYLVGSGRFREEYPPGKRSGRRSRFNGCVRYMMCQGYSLEEARRICASIARSKAAGRRRRGK